MKFQLPELLPEEEVTIQDQQQDLLLLLGNKTNIDLEQVEQEPHTRNILAKRKQQEKENAPFRRMKKVKQKNHKVSAAPTTKRLKLQLPNQRRQNSCVPTPLKAAQVKKNRSRSPSLRNKPKLSQDTALSLLQDIKTNQDKNFAKNILPNRLLPVAQLQRLPRVMKKTQKPTQNKTTKTTKGNNP